MKIHEAALSGLLPFKQYLKSFSLSCPYFKITLQVICHYFYVFMKYVIKFELTVQFSYERHAKGSHPTFAMATVPEWQL
jgi:hypothetical protein